MKNKKQLNKTVGWKAKNWLEGVRADWRTAQTKSAKIPKEVKLIAPIVKSLARLGFSQRQILHLICVIGDMKPGHPQNAKMPNVES